MRVLSVVGARPQFVKLAPIDKAFRNHLEHIIVHTGQHYDELLSDVFFKDLGISAPNVNLHVGSGNHGAQTAAILQGVEETLENYLPDIVLVYGDTNSTLAAAIAAVKMHIPLVHLEAGLRSFNRRMPEEHNRVLTDHASDLLLAPTEVAMGHLAKEGLLDRSILVGDVMTDVLFDVRERVIRNGLKLHDSLYPGEEYYVATLHRPDNTDNPARLSAIISELANLDKTVLLLTHPRLLSLSQKHGINLSNGNLKPVPSLAYPELVSAVMQSSGVITDSGGLQKEAFLLRVPTVTLRPETEWVETVDLGWNVLVDDPKEISSSVNRPKPFETDAAPYGEGTTAQNVLNAILNYAS